MQTSNLLKGNLLILIATIFFGINLPVQKILIPHWLSAVDLAAVRILAPAPLIWLVSLFFKNTPIDRGDRWTVFLSGAAFLFPFLYLFALSLRYASAIDVSIILTFPPIFVVVINALFRGHKITWLEVVGILISFGGALLMILGQGDKGGTHAPKPILGDCLAVASCICYALYLIFTEKVSGKYKPITLDRWVFLSACVPAIFFIGGVVKSPVFQHPELTPMLLLFGIVIICASFLSYLIIPPAIKFIGSDLVSMYQYLVPVVAVITCLLIKLDVLRWQQPVAFAIIILGVVLTTKAKRHQKKLKAAAAATQPKA